MILAYTDGHYGLYRVGFGQLSCLIVAVLVVYRQIQFIQSTRIGYNKDNVIRFDSEGQLMGTEETFTAELRKVPGVVDASFTQHNMVGRNYGTADLNWPGKNIRQDVYFEGFLGGYDFFETMGMQFAEGRGFSRAFGADTNKVVLNETAIKAMHLQKPIGQIIKMYGGNYQVIGVVKDFHFESLHEPVRPSFVLLAGGSSPFYKIMVKISSKDQKETIDRIRRLYESYNPGFPFIYNYLDAAYQKQYETETRTSTLAIYFSCLAIIHILPGFVWFGSIYGSKKAKRDWYSQGDRCLG